MTIKDVEKLTGLTAKSIRYYEQKGLFTVERNEENDYRNYTEVEVNRLKKIKLLRYLDFTVEDIKQVLETEKKDVQRILRQKAEDFSLQRDRCKDKQEWCLSLAKDYEQSDEMLDKIMADYSEAIDVLESDELAEIEEDLKDAAMPSFPLTFLHTLMFSGPVMWLFININDGKLEDLMINAILAVVCTVLITLSWVYYFIQYRKYKDRVKKKNRANLWVLPGTILLIVLGMTVMIWLMSGVESLLVTEGYYFLQYHPLTERFLAWFVMLPLLLAIMLLVAKLSRKNQKEMDKMGDLLYLWNRMGKWKWLAVAGWLIGLYCCLTSVTVVTPDSIICHSPLHPMGVAYSYSDVEQIITGFGQETFTFDAYNRKGEFYYQIVLDGKMITFHGSSWNEEIERYNEDTYLWIEEFDQALLNLGIAKTGDITGYQNCDLAQKYLERFIRIIENK